MTNTELGPECPIGNALSAAPASRFGHLLVGTRAALLVGHLMDIRNSQTCFVAPKTGADCLADLPNVPRLP